MSAVPFDKAKIQKSSPMSGALDGSEGGFNLWLTRPQTSLPTAMNCLPRRKQLLADWELEVQTWPPQSDSLSLFNLGPIFPDFEGYGG